MQNRSYFLPEDEDDEEENIHRTNLNKKHSFSWHFQGIINYQVAIIVPVKQLISR